MTLLPQAGGRLAYRAGRLDPSVEGQSWPASSDVSFLWRVKQKRKKNEENCRPYLL
jgi:hypothetical protein